MSSDISKVKKTKTSLKDQRAIITDWTDVFMSPSKDIGYSVIEFKDSLGNHVSMQYAYINKNQMLKKFSNETDTYISLNGFSNGSKELLKRHHTLRKSSNLKQIRSIVVDLDTYKLPRFKQVPIKQVVHRLITFLNDLQADNKLPMPNLLTYGHGIQLFWTFGDGLSPKLARSARFISKMFVKLLDNWGSDPKCIDPARLVRLPRTFNSRNHSEIVPIILSDQSYAYKDLLPYANKVHTEKSKSAFTGFAKHTGNNNLRCQDIEYLMSHRQDIEDCRHDALYIYAYSKDMDLRGSVEQLHAELVKFSKKCMPSLPDADLWYTSKSVVNEISDYYKALGNRDCLPANSDDGIIRPMKNQTIIDHLHISLSEQKKLLTIVGGSIQLIRKQAKATKKRRKQGIRSRELVDKLKSQPKIEFIKAVIKEMPYKTHAWIANSLGVSQSQVSKYFKKLSQGKYTQISSLSANELLLRLKKIMQEKHLHLFYTGNLNRWNEDDFEVALIVNLLITLYGLDEEVINSYYHSCVLTYIGKTIGKLKARLKRNLISKEEFNNSLYALNNKRQELFSKQKSLAVSN